MEAQALKVGRALLVIFHAVRGIVLAAVDFKNDFGSAAIEIHNIAAKLLLTAKADWIIREKIVPQMPLLRRHVPAELLRKRLVILTVIANHCAAPSFLPSPLGMGLGFPFGEAVAAACGCD